MTLVAMTLVAMNFVAMNLVAMNLCHRRFWKLFCCTPLALASGGLLSGCHQSKPAPPTDPSSMIHDVPIFPGPKLAPLDASALSGGKVTRYILNGNNPHSPTQEAMLEACRELPIQNATAKGASVVFKGSYGEVPVDALVVNQTTVLVEVGGIVRGLGMGLSVGKEEVLFGNPSIALTPKSKWAFVGKKKMPLHMTYYWAHNGYRVMLFQDLMTLIHERDAQIGGHTIQSAVVSYEPDPSKLYKQP